MKRSRRLRTIAPGTVALLLLAVASCSDRGNSSSSGARRGFCGVDLHYEVLGTESGGDLPVQRGKTIPLGIRFQAGAPNRGYVVDELTLKVFATSVTDVNSTDDLEKDKLPVVRQFTVEKVRAEPGKVVKFDFDGRSSSGSSLGEGRYVVGYLIKAHASEARPECPSEDTPNADTAVGRLATIVLT